MNKKVHHGRLVMLIGAGVGYLYYIAPKAQILVYGKLLLLIAAAIILSLVGLFILIAGIRAPRKP